MLFATVGLVVLLSSSGGAAQGATGHCMTFKRDRFNEFFAQMRSQTVFGGTGLVGWRVYGPPEVLQSLGMRPRDLITHFCGVALKDAVSTEGDIRCRTAVGDTVALTVVRDGESLQPIAPKDGAPVER